MADRLRTMLGPIRVALVTSLMTMMMLMEGVAAKERAKVEEMEEKEAEMTKEVVAKTEEVAKLKEERAVKEVDIGKLHKLKASSLQMAIF